MTYPLPESAICNALEINKCSVPDYPSIKSPTRMSFIMRQGLELFVFSCFSLCLAILFLIYVVLITFTILPLTVISRKWSNLPSWYLAPKEVQCHIYAYYRKNSKRLASEWDIEKAKPLPLARLRRGFVSQELITSSHPGSGLIARLPAELRLQIYREVIQGNSSHVHITVHRTQKPGNRRPMSRMHGHFCKFHITKIPVNDCICFDAGVPGLDGRAIPRCQAPYLKDSGRGILALSRTCRKIYMETIDLLYSQSWPFICRSLLCIYGSSLSVPSQVFQHSTSTPPPNPPSSFKASCPSVWLR